MAYLNSRGKRVVFFDNFIRIFLTLYMAYDRMINVKV